MAVEELEEIAKGFITVQNYIFGRKSKAKQKYMHTPPHTAATFIHKI